MGKIKKYEPSERVKNLLAMAVVDLEDMSISEAKGNNISKFEQVILSPAQNQQAEITTSHLINLQNKSKLKAMEKEIIDLVSEGEISGLKTFLAISELEGMLKKIKEAIRKTAVNEGEKFGKGSHSVYGRTFSVVESGHSYDYKTCDKWNEMKAEMQKLEAQLKEGWTDEETGEYIKVYVKSTTTIRIDK